MVTSTVQQLKQTRPRSLPFSICNEKILAKETTRQTTDATSVRSATCCNRDRLRISPVFDLPNFSNGRTNKIVIYRLIAYRHGQ